MKKTYLGLLVLCAGCMGIAFAQSIPDAFIVEAQPGSFGVNENVDLTIKAVKSNGETVKDYDGDVFIEIDGIVDPDDYVVPSDGLYTFLPQDQGVKLFSKGLMVKVPGAYSIIVSDIIDETIKGEVKVIVGSTVDTNPVDIAIISPAVGSTQITDPVEFFGKAEALPNSAFEVYLNGLKVNEGMTSSDGSFTSYVMGSQAGTNKAQIKIVNINNEVIGESIPVEYIFQSASDGVFEKIELLPNTTSKQGEKITFNVQTNDQVSSVELMLSGQVLPMDRITAGAFTKQVLMEDAGSFSASLALMVAGNKKLYTDIVSYSVAENIAIGPVKSYTTTPDKTSVTVEWEMIGVAGQYKIDYGVSETALIQSQTVTGNTIVLQNLNPEQTYYLKISPVNSAGVLIGTPSDIQTIAPGHLAPNEDGKSCVVNDIVVNTEKIGNKYYLYRNAVENAEKYVVYRSDFADTPIAQMQKMGESTDTRFEYPFNNLSTVDQYAFYAVQAICTDGSEVMLDAVKQVHVGPMDNILLLVTVTGLFYVGYRLYKQVV